jgi:hypothetical protein
LEDLYATGVQTTANARDVIFKVCSDDDKERAGVFATMVWVLWNNRNNKVWNDITEPGRNLGFKATQIWEEWFMAKTASWLVQM